MFDSEQAESNVMRLLKFKIIMIPLAAIFIVSIKLYSAFGWQGLVISVTDGDTITVKAESDDDLIKIRLYGIDAPERKQPYGDDSKKFAEDTSLQQKVEVEPKSKPDRYGRTVAVVYLASGVSLQESLLKAGLAWVWSRFCTNCADWEALKTKAQKLKRGIWADANPISPWEWRQLQNK